MSGFDDNPFGEPTVDNPFAVRNVITMLILCANFQNYVEKIRILINFYIWANISYLIWIYIFEYSKIYSKIQVYICFIIIPI